MRIPIIILLSFMFSAPAAAAQDCGSRAACEAACEKIERKIERIRARMRRGYGAREGERMQADLRRLRKRRLRTCR